MPFAAVLAAAATVAGCGDAGATITRLTVGTPGPDPYTLMSNTDQRRIEPGRRAGGTRRGDSPGLYGGTRRAASCDPRRLVAFLQANPDKARAWAGAQGIEPGGIARFVARLTPVLLRTDTLVTNHGYRDGKATGGPAVLQAGMGVLINEYGEPAVKCNCGNPLTRPQKKISTRNASYTGASWDGFGGRRVTRIEPRNEREGAVAVFVLVDPDATIGFGRPRATTGADDGPAGTLPPTEAAPTDGPSPGDSGSAEPGSGGPATPLPGDSEPGAGTSPSLGGTPGGGDPADPGVPSDGPGAPGYGQTPPASPAPPAGEGPPPASMGPGTGGPPPASLGPPSGRPGPGSPF
ncbi:DUF6777 domain-containing protein [Actinomadura yumaensis]|uniref:DUF6777 domain-containing protein n=1 Tax=Actinomadura yumaensis TaxID=111807 RepID=A0ABW2CWX3_9ACTN